MASTLKLKGQQLVYTMINPLVNMLVRFNVSPNIITSVGLGLNGVAAVIFVIGAEKGVRGELSYVGWAGVTILIAGLFDMIDGRLARVGKMSSTFGALYDSVLDRYSELIMFLGICYYLVSHDYFLSSLFAFVAMIGSMMISYTRARAEGLGIDCSVGIMQRPERIILIGLSALLCGVGSAFLGGEFKIQVSYLPISVFETISIFTFPISVLAVWANLTAIRRLRHCRRVLKERGEN